METQQTTTQTVEQATDDLAHVSCEEVYDAPQNQWYDLIAEEIGQRPSAFLRWRIKRAIENNGFFIPTFWDKLPYETIGLAIGALVLFSVIVYNVVTFGVQ